MKIKPKELFEASMRVRIMEQLSRPCPCCKKPMFPTESGWMHL